MTKSDAQIARQWASKALDNVFLNEAPIEGYRAAARHILSERDYPGDILNVLEALNAGEDIDDIRRHLEDLIPDPPVPTMADLDWVDDVHAGLCAEHEDGGVVLMLGPDPRDSDCILCRFRYKGAWVTDGLHKAYLTPIPGTRVDLTPRREPVPEFTPDPPAVLTTKEDYKNAPEGTIVAKIFSYPWVKSDSAFWLGCGEDEIATNRSMAFSARRVLRWGESL